MLPNGQKTLESTVPYETIQTLLTTSSFNAVVPNNSQTTTKGSLPSIIPVANIKNNLVTTPQQQTFAGTVNTAISNTSQISSLAAITSLSTTPNALKDDNVSCTPITVQTVVKNAPISKKQITSGISTVQNIYTTERSFPLIMGKTPNMLNICAKNDCVDNGESRLKFVNPYKTSFRATYVQTLLKRIPEKNIDEYLTNVVTNSNGSNIFLQSESSSSPSSTMKIGSELGSQNNICNEKTNNNIGIRSIHFKMDKQISVEKDFSGMPLMISKEIVDKKHDANFSKISVLEPSLTLRVKNIATITANSSTTTVAGDISIMSNIAENEKYAASKNTHLNKSNEKLENKIQNQERDSIKTEANRNLNNSKQVVFNSENNSFSEMSDKNLVELMKTLHFSSDMLNKAKEQSEKSDFSEKVGLRSTMEAQSKEKINFVCHIVPDSKDLESIIKIQYRNADNLPLETMQQYINEQRTSTNSSNGILNLEMSKFRFVLEVYKMVGSSIQDEKFAELTGFGKQISLYLLIFISFLFFNIIFYR